MSLHLQTDPSGAAASGALTILVVDDYQSIGEMISAFLLPCGYRVLTASSGREAKALAEANARIDLLLTDIEMPEMRGDELAAWFCGARAETRILFMSSEPSFRMALDPFHFLLKPFHVETLVSKVREVLHHHSASTTETAA